VTSGGQPFESHPGYSEQRAAIDTALARIDRAEFAANAQAMHRSLSGLPN